jgi:hypothetical protein
VPKGVTPIKRLVIGSVVALLATAMVTAAAAANPISPKKTWICHFTGKKYVAVYVNKATLKAHSLSHHGDIVTGVPQAKATAIRFCSAQVVLTPVKGGQRLESALSSTAPSLMGTLNLRLRLGQGDLCFQLTINAAQGTSVMVNSVTLARGTTSISLDLAKVTRTSGTVPVAMSACMPLSRDVVKQLLKNASDFTVTVSTSQGTLTGKLG